jgi:ubiquinone/menaquinone biosynthesis C-methylase UbiE
MNSRSTWYERMLLPYIVDLACGLRPIAAQRRKVIPAATGDVLEIGIGTGRNLEYYDKRKVHRLVGIDPAEQMHTLAAKRSRAAGLAVQLLPLSAEQLPVDSGSFDCVVCTYTLCSIQDPLAALCEVRRVLRPGGKLLFAEHGLAPDPAVVKWQARLEPLWSKLAGGCHLTRDVPALLQDAGFMARMESGYITRPKLLAFNYWGVATPS